MYDIEFRTFIKKATGVQNVAFGLAPDNTSYPLITIQNVSSDFGYTQNGLDSLNSMIYQVDVWATSYSSAFLKGNKVIDGCAAFIPKEYLKGVFVVATRQSVDTATSTKLFRYSVDIEVFYLRKL